MIVHFFNHFFPLSFFLMKNKSMIVYKMQSKRSSTEIIIINTYKYHVKLQSSGNYSNHTVDAVLHFYEK